MEQRSTPDVERGFANMGATVDTSAAGLIASPPVPAPAAWRSAPPRAADAPAYAAFYGLTRHPFAGRPDPEFLYHSASHERAAQEMLSAIRRREPLVVVTGAAAAGKTIVLQAVVEELDSRTLVSVAAGRFRAGEDLLKSILVDFGVISRGRLSAERIAHLERGELIAAVRDFLASLAPLDAFAVVIVDGVERLPADAVDALSELSALEEGTRRLQIVLVGRPIQHPRRDRPELDGLLHRAAVRCEIGPLEKDEVGGYIERRLFTAGADPRVEFREDAVARIYQLSAGVPGLVNAICDAALAAGREVSTATIDANLIDGAARALGVVRPASPAGSFVRVTAVVLAVALLLIVANRYTRFTSFTWLTRLTGLTRTP
ncbi:MAG: ExeA family protein [Betaproteobacteria bacterium]